MKTSKIFLMGIPVLALVFGLALAGCEDGAQEVEGTVSVNPNRASSPSNVTVTPGTTSYTVKWEAADNAKSYSLVYQMEGTKSIVTLTNSGGNPSAVNPDEYTYTSYGSFISGKQYRIGVIATDYWDNKSDIAWSEYKTF
jgi:hypothetical protein